MINKTRSVKKAHFLRLNLCFLFSFLLIFAFNNHPLLIIFCLSYSLVIDKFLTLRTETLSGYVFYYRRLQKRDYSVNSVDSVRY